MNLITVYIYIYIPYIEHIGFDGRPNAPPDTFSSSKVPPRPCGVLFVAQSHYCHHFPVVPLTDGFQPVLYCFVLFYGRSVHLYTEVFKQRCDVICLGV